MKQTVYVDVLLFLNLIIAFLLLKSAALLSGVPASRIRLFFGTITGSAASLLIFVQMNPVESILTKLLLGLSLSGIVFLKRKKYRLFFRAFLSFLLVNFIFAGFMTAVFLLFPARGMVFRNGIVYFHFSAISLVVLSVIAYALIRLVCRIVARRTDRHQTASVHIQVGCTQVILSALIDTGNRLNDPFSGLPVIVVTYDAIQSALPLKWTTLCSAMQNGTRPAHENHPAYRSFRMVPVQTISGTSVLPAFCPDRIEVSGEEKRAVVAVTEHTLSNGSYDAILPPTLISSV